MTESVFATVVLTRKRPQVSGKILFRLRDACGGTGNDMEADGR
jgi:hypothetical protein